MRCVFCCRAETNEQQHKTIIISRHTTNAIVVRCFIIAPMEILLVGESINCIIAATYLSLWGKIAAFGYYYLLMYKQRHVVLFEVVGQRIFLYRADRRSIFFLRQRDRIHEEMKGSFCWSKESKLRFREIEQISRTKQNI